MADFDLVVRGGTVIDGSGGDRFEGDVAVKDGRIAEVGAVAGTGAEEIDAKGHLVTPGFVDVHTHFDGQATWDSRLTPTSWHGVTTAVMGNCGVGFAPCKPEDHDRLISLMEGVEDIPGPVLTEGLDWSWESFPEFLDSLERIPHDIDFAAQVPHGALRVYVMGQRGADREPATPDDIAAMAALARDAVAAGGIGFSTSRTLNHRTAEGDPVPTMDAEADELIGIAMGLKEAGRGVLQVVSDLKETEDEFMIFRRMVEASGRPLSLSLLQNNRYPERWRDILGLISKAADDGLPMKAQVCGRPVGLVLGLELTLSPVVGCPTYEKVKHLPLAERVAELRKPEVKAAILKEQPESLTPFLKRVVEGYDEMFVLGDPPDYEQPKENTIGAIAAQRGIAARELAYDILTAGDGRNTLYYPFLNYSYHSLDTALEMMRHPATVLGLGDGGAHVGMICDASFATTMLTHWTRDRTRGEKLPLEWVIKAHTAETAALIGLRDRGILKPGLKADLNVIDYDRLRLRGPEVWFDLPAGGRRLVQRAQGYAATVVSGQVVYRNGEATDALPGRLIRGPQGA